MVIAVAHPSDSIPLSPGSSIQASPARGNSAHPPCTESDDDDVPSMNLTHFSYNNAPSSSNLIPPRPGITRKGCGEVGPVLKRKSAHRFSSDFSDADLAKLAKCVGCDLKWTARKTAHQKMIHIQACAKKNAFTDETIRILIWKEIDLVTAHNEAACIMTESNTYMEDIVAHAAPRKKGRRQRAAQTVQTIEVTRSNILNRAQALLGPSSSDALPCTQPVGSASPRINPTIPLPSQTFGASVLGRKYTVKARNLFTEDEPSDTGDGDEFCGTTQTFAPSGLGMNAKHAVVDVCFPAVSCSESD